jgi:hypothetical protein
MAQDLALAASVDPVAQGRKADAKILGDLTPDAAAGQRESNGIIPKLFWDRVGRAWRSFWAKILPVFLKQVHLILGQCERDQGLAVRLLAHSSGILPADTNRMLALLGKGMSSITWATSGPPTRRLAGDKSSASIGASPYGPATK